MPPLVYLLIFAIYLIHPAARNETNEEKRIYQHGSNGLSFIPFVTLYYELELNSRSERTPSIRTQCFGSISWQGVKARSYFLNTYGGSKHSGQFDYLSTNHDIVLVEHSECEAKGR
jgi:hypothetical protein